MREPDPIDRAARRLLSAQRENGCWEGEMVWCTMILAQYIIVRRITVSRSTSLRARKC